MMTAPTKHYQYSLLILLSEFDFVQDLESSSELESIVVTGITDDSREVVVGDLFIARSGIDHHGQNFISDAIHSGANAVLCDSDSDNARVTWPTTEKQKIPVISIPKLNQYIGNIVSTYYKHPSSKMYITGITGTNGKTTCAYMLSSIVDSCGIIGTLGTGFIDNLTVSNNTTPGVIANHRIISDLYGQATKDLVMEVSSHALQQRRIDAIDINCAVFTNLTHEHLDYHGSMQQYENEKLKLFQLSTLQFAVVNMDDPFSKKILVDLADKVKTITYTIKPNNTHATIRAENICYTLQGVDMTIHTVWGSENVSLPVLGKFNVSNCLAVLGVLLQKNMALPNAIKLLTKIKPVPGRMQQIVGNNKQPLAVVDYAHTPDALKQVLQTLSLHCIGKLWCVFGCGGDRDISKRTLMGKTASELSDYVVITNDNPRTENPQKIINEIKSGIEHKDHVLVIEDRKKAICTALLKAKENDIVLIAGKGHENYQIINSTKIEFSDANTVTKLFEEVICT